MLKGRHKPRVRDELPLELLTFPHGKTPPQLGLSGGIAERVHRHVVAPLSLIVAVLSSNWTCHHGGHRKVRRTPDTISAAPATRFTVTFSLRITKPRTIAMTKLSLSMGATWETGPSDSARK